MRDVDDVPVRDTPDELVDPTGTTAGFADRMLDYRDRRDLFDNPDWRRLEDCCAGPQAGRRAAALPESGRRASDG